MQQRAQTLAYRTGTGVKTDSFVSIVTRRAPLKYEARAHGRSANTQASDIGRPMKRREDPRLLTGTGRYVDDLAPRGCLHAVCAVPPTRTLGSLGLTSMQPGGLSEWSRS